MHVTDALSNRPKPDGLGCRLFDTNTPLPNAVPSFRLAVASPVAQCGPFHQPTPHPMNRIPCRFTHSWNWNLLFFHLCKHRTGRALLHLTVFLRNRRNLRWHWECVRREFPFCRPAPATGRSDTASAGVKPTQAIPPPRGTPCSRKAHHRMECNSIQPNARHRFWYGSREHWRL
jgi:hypothetical protein